MRKRNNLFFATLLAISLTACSTNNGGESPSSNEKVMHVQLQPNTWTYLSLAKGATVGTSNLGDIEADKSWHAPTGTWPSATEPFALTVAHRAKGRAQ